jgi:hypothetical protein
LKQEEQISSAQTSIRSQSPSSNSRKQNSSRPYSSTMIDQFNSSEYNQLDLTPALTKSALIYQLIRSRLQANLAKSLSANKDRLNNKDISNI